MRSTQVSAALKAEVPPKQPHVANNMSVVQPGKDKHRVRAMASSRYFGVKAVEEQTSYGLPYEPVRLGAGSIYKIFTAATALKKGLGINDVIAVPPDGYTSPIYKDGSGQADPGAQRRRLRRPDDAAGRARAVAEHRVRQA